ncbi:arylesterase [Adhaeribacter rhizoryzae]|uniref:Arylesterase n=1 Tax=Adhaeribacter rhizoryzae TaxID=2607907 RepID=A0A5M6DNM5_9BACT|nr:arylesterase [Adhaeribacter rhizoryzae]KAA5549084.1 arylesterase [Adhaeribacter rhizoryzae]
MLKNIIYAWLFSVLVLAGCNSDSKNQAQETTTAADKAVEENKKVEMKTILFFGNSLTAGYGLDPSEAFPALIQQKIDSLDLPYKIINAGLSGETTAGGKNRIDWLLRQKIDVFVLELGANDGLRGIPVTETARNLQIIVDKVKAKYPDVKLVLAGMEIPPNMGGKYAAEFRVIFRQIAEKNNMAFVPFLLQGVGGVRELNQGDGIHPTEKGHRILAENVWEILQTVL